ncbi:phage tail tube protein [Staphylococcus aureus]|uniref:phage tail tube protein n=1 Tax=Staphylococcus aureus TaxID=1280 RepID=UPI0023AFB6E2|nr:phage tail tube protein [Staphylococcus aureus]MDE8535507.1 phage tail tube protein [Staphylococcus aureus]
MTEYAGFLAELYCDMNGGTVYTKIAQVRDISGPGAERESLDASHRDSPGYWRKHIKGFKDGGELTFDVVFDPDSATHGTASTGIWGDLDDDVTMPTWRLVLSTAGTISFSGFVQSIEPSDPMDEVQMMDVTIKVNGKPALTH